jgi:NitT/TauT family transport system substrate-binding protein
MKLRKTMGCFSFCFIFFLTVGGVLNRAFAQDSRGGLERIKIAYAAIGGNNAPIWITHEAGYFRKEGLSTELIFMRGGTLVVQAMLAGEIQFGYPGGAASISARLRGADITIIAVPVNVLPYWFFTRPDIDSGAKLKGKKVATSTFGGESHVISQYVVGTLGLDPVKDVIYMQVGSTPTRLIALKTNSVQAALLSTTEALEARKAGLTMLVDVTKMGLAYPFNVLATTDAYIAKNRATVQRAVKALVEGIRYMKANEQKTVEIIAKYTRISDLDAIKASFEPLARIIEEKPFPNMRGIQFVLDEFGKKDPNAKVANPADFVDLSFLKNLEKEGMFR